mmetsp:Transcript_123370/g.360223  ORF Transcript_123370/g.360223 Transcript_123370/m.360223 type:complete len:203 (+) Transcript_123370:893-1501(+)
MSSLKPTSSRIRPAVARVFSQECFLWPGRQVLETRWRSGVTSAVSSSSRFSEPTTATSIKAATSTTRTSFRCSWASCMRRHLPRLTSLVRSRNDFACPWPKRLRSTLCSFSTHSTALCSSASSAWSVMDFALCSRSAKSLAFISAPPLHSNWCDKPSRVIWNFFCRYSEVCRQTKLDRAFADSESSVVKRPNSSLRRSLMPW